MADLGHGLDGQMLLIVLGNVLEDVFGLCNGFLRSCPRKRFALIVKQDVEHLKQLALDCQRIGNRIVFTDLVGFVNAGGKRRIPGESRSNYRGKIGDALGQRLEIVSGAGVGSLSHQHVQMEDDVFVFHGFTADAFDGMELAGKDQDNVACSDRIALQIDTDCAAAFFNVNNLKFLMPVERNKRKIQRYGTDVGDVGEIRSAVDFLFVVMFISGNVHVRTSFVKMVPFLRKTGFLKHTAGRKTEKTVI